MTTKTFDSTVSQILQDDSSVEYVAPEKNPTTTVQNDELIFGQKHNDIDCALCPTAKRACDRAWVTAKQVENWSGMSTTTLWRWLGKLEKARRISLVSDMIPVNVPTTTGAKRTTFYNLNVLNQLAMVCIDNEKLNEVSCKFSDILSEVETTGSYSIRKPDSYMIENPIERAKRWIEETKTPCSNTQKQGVFFLSSASSTGRCRSFSDDKDFDKKPEISANLRL